MIPTDWQFWASTAVVATATIYLIGRSASGLVGGRGDGDRQGACGSSGCVGCPRTGAHPTVELTLPAEKRNFQR